MGPGKSIPQRFRKQLAHSPLHGMKTSTCKTAWQDMRGSAEHRECPECSAIVLRVDDMDEEQMLELLFKWEPRYDPKQLRLSVRPEGTFLLLEKQPATYQRIGKIYFSLYGIFVLLFVLYAACDWLKRFWPHI